MSLALFKMLESVACESTRFVTLRESVWTWPSNRGTLPRGEFETTGERI